MCIFFWEEKDLKIRVFIIMMVTLSIGSLMSISSYQTSAVNCESSISIVPSNEALVGLWGSGYPSGSNQRDIASFTITNKEIITRTITRYVDGLTGDLIEERTDEAKRLETSVSDASVSITNRMAKEMNILSFDGRLGDTIVHAENITNPVSSGETVIIPITLSGTPENDCDVECTLKVFWEGGKAMIIRDVKIFVVNTTETEIIERTETV